MSTCPKLLGSGWLVASLLVLASSFAHGQTVGGDGVGPAVAIDLEDLQALGECLRVDELRQQIDPLLAAGEKVTDLTFGLFFQTQTGDRIYIGSITVGNRAWYWIHHRPASSNSPIATYVRPKEPTPGNRPVVPDLDGLDFLVHALIDTPGFVTGAYISALSSEKLTGLRVEGSYASGREPEYRVHLFFDGETVVPRLIVGAKLVGGVFTDWSVN